MAPWRSCVVQLSIFDVDALERLCTLQLCVALSIRVTFSTCDPLSFLQRVLIYLELFQQRGAVLLLFYVSIREVLICSAWRLFVIRERNWGGEYHGDTIAYFRMC